MHAERPNEMLHLDFCHMGKADTGDSYILVVKDDFSSYTWMFVCETADVETVADSLLDLMVGFGFCDQWVSDQGTHFKNEVLRLVCDKLHITHHFTQPYCPWSNGTVEVVNREMTRIINALLSEFSLP